jgi:4-hydroxy-tetrahydrodipicolinate synthase
MTDQSPRSRFGLSCALLTPFDNQGNVDATLLAAHVRTRLAAGCSSVTLFGTTGEGTSIGDETRARTLDGLRRYGIDMEKHVVVGVAATSAEGAIAQARQATLFDCRTLLLAPPFYFKDVGEEGLTRWFSVVLEGIRDQRQRVILYHLPSMTMVPLSQTLIETLKTRYPELVVGVKDSSGDWHYARELLERHRELAILIGDERRLAEAVRMGAEGAISGLANVAAELLLPLVNDGREDPRVNKIVDEILRYPVVPGLKALCAHLSGDEAWRAVAPPLEALDSRRAARLSAAFDAAKAEASAK